MAKMFIFFSFLWYILGNPFVALIVLLLIVYVVDRRYIGLFPSLFKPLKRMRQIARLQTDLRLNPHDTSAKRELARLYMERGKYGEAMTQLQQIRQVLDDSDEVLADMGICHLKLGELDEGEALILQALEQRPRIKYGEPLLELGEAFTHSRPDAAIRYLEQFKDIQSSSCKAYYRLGQLYERLGQKPEAAAAYREAVSIYGTLPKYMRKSERRWYILSRLKTLQS